MEDAARVYLVFFGVAAVVVDAVDHEFLFFGREEFASFGGEIDDYEPADGADEDGYGTFDYEDPWDSVNAELCLFTVEGTYIASHSIPLCPSEV